MTLATKPSHFRAFLSRNGVDSIDACLIKFSLFLLLVLGLPAPAYPAPLCSALFAENPVIAQTENLEQDFALLRQNLEGSKVLSAPQVEALNLHFNRWLNLTEKNYNQIQEREQLQNMSEAETRETLAQVQSLYLSYFDVINPIRQNLKWRRVLNHADETRTKNSFEQIHEILFSKDLFYFYKDLLERTSQGREISDGNLRFVSPEDLENRINQIRRDDRFTRARDLGRRALEHTIAIVAEGLGITSDNFPLRAGKLYARPDVMEEMTRNLKPLDVLVDRAAGFKLSHMLIPGHFGHTGIYLGTKEQLIEAGLWNHPALIPYQAQIEAGLVMLEAKRTGVKLRALKEYTNTDSFTAIRRHDLSLASAREKLAAGLSQIGKTFDHSFELEHTESFFCSKLVYFTFQDVPWFTGKIVGRTSLPPDNIAVQAMGDKRYFDPVLAYQNGEKVTGDLQKYIDALKRNHS
ncbi:MAG: YiiX/YebB-like N1pC/P60 family cysteine hydrolase [Pseudobdellovibrio sp.]